ncbi:MAG: phosphoserine phosphatase, partial [Candidatus Methanomethylophilaceae archaeon]|nr:phosphoserine phosphatase [Candidatus Methanomethylophilaceae archaeon]
EAKAQAETYHRQVSEYSEKAQASHDKMLGYYEQAGKLRKEADAAQAKFLECKQAADEEHKKHMEQVKLVHQTDRDPERGRKTGGPRGGKKRVDSDGKKEAKEIFERFKAGDKLSTEDLMALQKSGYL